MSSFVCGNEVTTALLAQYENHLLCMVASCICTANTLLIVFLHLTKHDFDITGFPSNSSIQFSELESSVLYSSGVIKLRKLLVKHPVTLFIAFHWHKSYVLTIPDLLYIVFFLNVPYIKSVLYNGLID